MAPLCVSTSVQRTFAPLFEILNTPLVTISVFMDAAQQVLVYLNQVQYMFVFLVIRELTEEERRKIMVSEDFQMFFNRAACIVERALCEDVDIFHGLCRPGE